MKKRHVVIIVVALLLALLIASLLLIFLIKRSHSNTNEQPVITEEQPVVTEEPESELIEETEKQPAVTEEPESELTEETEEQPVVTEEPESEPVEEPEEQPVVTDKFESDFVEATAEQKAAAVEKIERLIAIEKAVKKNEQLDGEDVKKSNMIMTGLVVASLEMSQDGMTIEIKSEAKTVEKYDFSTPGAYKIYTRCDICSAQIVKELSQEMIAQIPDGVTADSLIGREFGTKKSLEMFVDTSEGTVYLSITTQTISDPFSEPIENTTKIFVKDYPMEGFEESFQNNQSAFSVEEILQKISDEVCLVGVDSNGNIKITEINDDTVDDLVYTIIFENDNNYSAKKTFKRQLDPKGYAGAFANCEMTILPTEDKVEKPTDTDEYSESDALTLSSLFINFLKTT